MPDGDLRGRSAHAALPNLDETPADPATPLPPLDPSPTASTLEHPAAKPTHRVPDSRFLALP
ncbi:sigma-70 family RNA polymerase sigma factor, partial [Streptomyces griseus]|nr:sigma-70 family RNA polymerase sigma factor [Streptomyces griseus]